MERMSWSNLPCLVPGYDMTAGEYASLIRDRAESCDFASLSYYISAAEKSGAIFRIALAAKENLIKYKEFEVIDD
jgi:hypothetical protein